MELSRRDFLKVAGVSAAGTVLFAGCAAPENEMLIQSPVLLPEDTPYGFEQWYASACRGCDAGCGIIVRVVEGRAKKIEGNPDHPLNRGKLCARGQAGVQDLYHPDRIRTPLRRTGPRGSGRYQVISWDDALAELTGRLKNQAELGSPDSVVLITEPLQGLTGHITQRFANTYGARHMAYEPMEQAAFHKGVRDVFGEDRTPLFDIERSNYVLSFGANFLEPWISQVYYGRAYGEFRQGSDRSQRGYLVQIEPRLSQTAANADEWVPITPGSEGVLALSIAQVLIAEGLADQAAANAMTGGAGAAALNAFRPELAATLTGIDAGRIVELARAFAKTKPALAIGGSNPAAHTNGTFNLTAIFALNFLVGAVNTPGGILANATAPVDEFGTNVRATPYREWERFAQRLRDRSQKPVNVLMVHNANPLYGLPISTQLGEGLRNVPVIVSFSHIMDETTAMADLILPDNAYLESWGDVYTDPGMGFPALTLQQPVVRPLYSTRQFSDVLLSAAAELGDALTNALPWKSYREALQATGDKIRELNKGSIQSDNLEAFMNGVLQRGGWWDLISPTETISVGPPLLPREINPARFAGADTEFPFYMTIYPSAGVNDGRGAHLPWLQMMPDPMTTAAWQSWVEINPTTAEQLGIKIDDVVSVISPNGRMEAPVYIYPAIPPNVVAIPAGQGHTFMGRYAEARGANPLSILAPMTEGDTGALAWNATRVRIERTGKRYRLPRLEGMVKAVQPEDYTIIQIAGQESGEGH